MLISGQLGREREKDGKDGKARPWWPSSSTEAPPSNSHVTNELRKGQRTDGPRVLTVTSLGPTCELCCTGIKASKNELWGAASGLHNS